MVEQKVPLVCFKDGSEEIVGINMLFVKTKWDHDFLDDLYKSVSSAHPLSVLNVSKWKSLFQFKSQVTKDIFDLMMILYENFDTFEYYGVDEYLTSFGLSVDRKYRGRKIGDEFLDTRYVVNWIIISFFLFYKLNFCIWC